MFTGDLSSFTDIWIKDLRKTLASENPTFPRKHTFGNGFTVTRIMCNVSPHTFYFDLTRMLRY